MDLIIGHQRMKLSNLFMRSISNFLPNTSIGSVRCLCYASTRLEKITLAGDDPNFGTRLPNYQTFRNYSLVNQRLFKDAFCEFEPRTVRNYTTETPKKESTEPKPSIFQRMKQMSKDYWHILIPVHVATSLVWISIFYIAVKNGVDIGEIFKYLNLSETYVEKIRNSKAGHWAVAYALFKVCTPIRYTVTIGGTTMTIRYFNKWGIMKFKTPEKMKPACEVLRYAVK
ncbi:protein FAM210A isoform X2 [Belonocnema kinseyi]|uniref:protein FAM210A isoform X2 n=1 Tax=Belonocnema kinseyi TaxID=2817044 RepID=UPI00143D427C|nr:protein FAM210A isoform X2 [Belonocnema kinseyi]